MEPRINRRLSDIVSDDFLSSDEEDEGEAGGVISSGLVPRYSGEPNRKTPEPHYNDDLVMGEEDALDFDDPDLMESVEWLPNGYFIRFVLAKWRLYDEKGDFVEEYDDKPHALAAAFARKPLGGLRP